MPRSVRGVSSLQNLLFTAALGALLIVPVDLARSADPTPQQQALRQIYRELIEINTTDSVGDTVKAAETMAAHLRAAGLPADDVKVIPMATRKGNLVARLRGTGARKPILLLGHLDVVEAKRDDWDFDPFKLQEVDGFFRGRGAIDDKAMAAIFVANLVEYMKEGFKPDRDIILALTTDEEQGADAAHNGARFLVERHRDLIDAELAINEGGFGALKDGKPQRNSIQVAEKVFATFDLEGKDPGGHSSVPRRDNPIYRLADALGRIGRYDFPVKLNPVTTAFFERVATIEEKSISDAIRALLAGRTDAQSLEPLSSRAPYNAQIRTTCVATMLQAGHAQNALPQTARATVNCRVLPGESVDEVERTLVRLIDDSKIALTRRTKVILSPPSPLNPEVLGAVERLSAEMWPGVPVIPTMSTGATDSLLLRNIGMPAYGVSGLFSDPANNGVHGLNEQVGVKELYDSKEFLYRLIKRLAAPSQFSQR
jgi:acetylornithine deacetylase/succinyl-diaminopimelate desuccinylase-like protein